MGRGDLKSCNILLDKLGLVYNENCGRKLMNYFKYHELQNWNVGILTAGTFPQLRKEKDKTGSQVKTLFSNVCLKKVCYRLLIPILKMLLSEPDLTISFRNPAEA